MKGKIVRLVRDKGFGFITPDEGDKDLFFHARSLPPGVFDTLNEGQVVTYEVQDGEKGPAAVNLAVVG
jgi:CspA family cold shock protein